MLTAITSLDRATGVRVYFDYFTQEWKVSPSVAEIPLLNGTNYTTNVNFTAKNSTFVSDVFYRSSSTDEPHYKLLFDNCDFEINSSYIDFASESQPKIVEWNNCRVSWERGSSTWNIEERFTITNSEFTLFPDAIVNFSAPEVNLSNVEFKAHPYFDPYDYASNGIFPVQQGVSFTGTDKLNLRNVTKGPDIGRSENFFIGAFDTVLVKDVENFAYTNPGNIRSTTYGGRGLRFSDDNNRSFISIDGFTAHFRDEESNRNSVMIDFHDATNDASATAYTIDHLYINNVYPKGDQPDSLNIFIRGNQVTVNRMSITNYNTYGLPVHNFLSAPENYTISLYSGLTYEELGTKSSDYLTQYATSITAIPTDAKLANVYLGPNGERWKIESSAPIADDDLVVDAKGSNFAVLQPRSDSWYHLQDFGAIGTDTLPDTTAVAKAIELLSNTTITNKNLWVDDGSYYAYTKTPGANGIFTIDGGGQLIRGFRIEGNPGKAKFIYPVAANNSITRTMFYIRRVSDFTVRGITFMSSEPTDVTTANGDPENDPYYHLGTALQFVSGTPVSRDILIDKCTFQYTNGITVNMGQSDSENFKVTNSVFKDIMRNSVDASPGDPTGILVNGTNTKNVTIDNCIFKNIIDLEPSRNNAHGVYLSKLDGALVTNCTFDRLDYRSMDIEEYTSGGIQVFSGVAKDILLTNNKYNNVTSYLLDCTDCISTNSKYVDSRVVLADWGKFTNSSFTTTDSMAIYAPSVGGGLLRASGPVPVGEYVTYENIEFDIPYEFGSFMRICQLGFGGADGTVARNFTFRGYWNEAVVFGAGGTSTAETNSLYENFTFVPDRANSSHFVGERASGIVIKNPMFIDGTSNVAHINLSTADASGIVSDIKVINPQLRGGVDGYDFRAEPGGYLPEVEWNNYEVSAITNIPVTASVGSVWYGPNGERWEIQSSSISGFNSDDVFGRTVIGGSTYAYQVDKLILPDGYVTLGSGQDSIIRAANTVAMLAAFNASVSLGLPLELPNDVVECGYAGTLHLFTVNQNATNGNRYLQVVGKGEKSEISIPSVSTSSTTMNIFNLGTDIEFDFKDFKISGPKDNWSPLRTGTYSISSGSDTLIRVSGQNFASITVNSVTDDHVGRYITVDGAGPGGSNLRAYIISVIDNDNVVLNTSASTTVASADGSWYGAWSQVLSQNMVINHNGNTFEQMGGGKSMTFYPGRKQVDASGFTWPTDIEGAFLYVYDGSSKTIKLRITRRISSNEVLINTEFNEEIAFEETYVANTSDTYYQTQSRCYMNNLDIVGYFRGGMSFGDGAQDIQVNDSYISIFGTAIGTEPDFSTISMFDCRFNASNLTIDGAGIHYNGDGNVHPNDGNERIAYFGNGTGINWNGGYVDGNYRTGISIFGGGSNTVDYDRYRPIYIDGVEFGSRLKRSIQTGAYQQHFLSNMVLKGAFHYRGIHASLDKVDVDINLNDPTVSNIYTAETNRPIRLEPTDAGYYLSWTNSNLKINGANQGFIVMDDLNSDSTEDEDRNVNFSNVNIYYNWRSTPTVDIAEEIIQLGDGATYNFDGVNVYARTTNNYTNGYILFREARNIYWANSNIYIRNNSNTISRYFRIDDEVSDKILDNVIFENIVMKGWTGSSFAEVGNFGEVYRMTNATNFTLNNVNRSFLSLNGTSSITKKEINGSSVYFDNENTISANGYGSGNIEHDDISATESQYVGIFTTNEKLTEKKMGEINEVNSFYDITTDSTITPTNGDMIVVSLASNDVALTISDANIVRNGIIWVHLLDLDAGFDITFNTAGGATGYRLEDSVTATSFTLSSGSGREGMYMLAYDSANNIFRMSH